MKSERSAILNGSKLKVVEIESNGFKRLSDPTIFESTKYTVFKNGRSSEKVSNYSPSFDSYFFPLVQESPFLGRIPGILGFSTQMNFTQFVLIK